MKIIDKTPLHDEKGQLSLVGRIQGTLKYGLSWSAELEAQKAIVAQFNRVFDKGYVLIRNFTLPNSEIVIPLILLGPGGVYVMHVTTVKGFFEAKGDQWNTVNNGASQPAAINLLTRVSRYAKAVQIYLERINVELKSAVEPILITFDPGAHVESMRPIARVIQSDAVKQFANTVLQARPVWRLDFAYSLADIIIDPTSVAQGRRASPPPEQPQSPGDRAQAIFDASNNNDLSDTDNLGFAFDEETPASERSANVSRTSVTRGARPDSKLSQKGKLMGLTTQQLILLGVLFLCECIILVGFGYFILSGQ